MSAFIGKYEVKADVKGRIFIPSPYRKQLPEGYKDRVVLHRDVDNNCIILYPENIWNTKLESLKENLDEWNPTDQLLLMHFVSDAEILDIDSQGRILLAKKYLQSISIENSEVLFVGMIDRIAVWSTTGFESSKLSQAEYASLLKEKMMKPSKSQAV